MLSRCRLCRSSANLGVNRLVSVVPRILIKDPMFPFLILSNHYQLPVERRNTNSHGHGQSTSGSDFHRGDHHSSESMASITFLSSLPYTDQRYLHQHALMSPFSGGNRDHLILDPAQSPFLLQRRHAPQTIAVIWSLSLAIVILHN